MKPPVMKKEDAQLLLDKKFVRVYDLGYGEGKHYFSVSRRKPEDLAAFGSEQEHRCMLPDAVTCVVIIQTPAAEPRLVLSYEYRYPVGRFLLSPPAGLIDPEDRTEKAPLLSAAKREIFEETGLTVTERDRSFVINPCCFSSPGLTDESNALVAVVLNRRELPRLDQSGAVGSECFDGFELVSPREAEEILERGTDPAGHFYSVYTWCALQYFVSGKWRG